MPSLGRREHICAVLDKLTIVFKDDLSDIYSVLTFTEKQHVWGFIVSQSFGEICTIFLEYTFLGEYPIQIYVVLGFSSPFILVKTEVLLWLKRNKAKKFIQAYIVARDKALQNFPRLQVNNTCIGITSEIKTN